MKRAGVLLLAAVPVIATGVYFVMPTDSADTPVTPPAATAQSSREDAKDRAEQEREADDALIADLPPGLASPAKKELAQQLVSSAENSTTRWRTAYGTIDDLGDGCGYTAGIIGFCTGTHDLLTLVERYTEAHPGNGLAEYLPALRKVDGSDSHEGLDPGFTAAWQAEAEVPAFREAQEEERDRVYFEPAVRLAKLDGLGTLGQFVYYDAMVFHGPDTDADGFYGLRERAMKQAETPAEGGSEKAYLDAFLDVRHEAMKAKRPGIDTSRVDTAQRRFLQAGNMDLDTPLVWEMYGDTYRVP
ncbi:chitosanase [Streptomyces viridiviolaceus]|uniref:Chitosanase n=1 Tax=Streptomyces viridiviolaceus TaxID=68282 RepID=A0ABW2DVV6_9ACTN|nr:chitosanase [Streptomyces viridiviolaceus]GHB30743.1 chitosanase [Streptomyces viridiviolaceus]